MRSGLRQTAGGGRSPSTKSPASGSCAASAAPSAAPRPPAGASEHEIQQAILAAVGGRDDVRLWRNNVGAARRRSGGLVQLGLKGSSDLLGFLAPSGRFLAIEVKSAAGRIRPEQKAFGDAVTRFGGLFIVARSVEEAVAAINAAQQGGSR